MSLRDTFHHLFKTFRRAVVVVILMVLIGASTIALQSEQARTRRFTRSVEFDFLDWTLSAVCSKIGQWSLGTTDYLIEPTRRDLVDLYLRDLGELQNLQRQFEELYAEPDQTGNEPALDEVGEELERAQVRVRKLRPVVETILQEDIGVELQAMGFDIAGAPFPPVLMQFTPLPSALIVSPRDEIRQEANITLQVGLSIEEKVQLEENVEANLDVSALVVPIGGLGTYPTMIQRSTTLSWITEVIGHEWTHNYLALHPLGFNYAKTPELRTMNETTASLMGVEFSRHVLSRVYPEYLPPQPAPEPAQSEHEQDQPVEDIFDFRAEMRETRLRVDELLAEGQIGTAEQYMEERRAFFWENGYRIRKLKQAYFAFHGAYADEPGGAAGDDPVGSAVRALWDVVDSPPEFLRLMAELDSYQDLEDLLELRLTNR